LTQIPDKIEGGTDGPVIPESDLSFSSLLSDVVVAKPPLMRTAAAFQTAKTLGAVSPNVFKPISVRGYSAGERGRYHDLF
jgi:hypothetical protein